MKTVALYVLTINKDKLTGNYNCTSLDLGFRKLKYRNRGFVQRFIMRNSSQ